MKIDISDDRDSIFGHLLITTKLQSHALYQVIEKVDPYFTNVISLTLQDGEIQIRISTSDTSRIPMFGRLLYEIVNHEKNPANCFPVEEVHMKV